SASACAPDNPASKNARWSTEPVTVDGVRGVVVSARAPDSSANLRYQLIAMDRFVWIAGFQGDLVPGDTYGSPADYLDASFAASRPAIERAVAEPSGTAAEPGVSKPATPKASSPAAADPTKGVFVANDYEAGTTIEGLAELTDPQWESTATQRVLTSGWLYRDTPPADANRRLDWLPRPCDAKLQISPDLVQQAIERQQASRPDGTEARLLLQMSSAAEAKRVMLAIPTLVSRCSKGWSAGAANSSSRLEFEHRFEDNYPAFFRRYQLRLVGEVIWIGIVEGEDKPGTTTDTQSDLAKSFDRTKAALEP
ncbi:MAG: hypothetical protein ACRC0L_04300, partial [Angustibacter sp.]